MADKDQDDKKKSFKSFKKDDKAKPDPKDEKKDKPDAKSDEGKAKPVTNSEKKPEKKEPPKAEKEKPSDTKEAEPKKGKEDKPEAKVGSKKPKAPAKDKKVDKPDTKVDGGEEGEKITGKKANNEVMINPDVEETGENIEEELSYSERKRRGRTMKRFKKKLQIAKKRQSKRSAKQDRLKKRSRRGATNIVRQKVAGKKGKDYKNLSVGQKQAIDKRVARRKSMIDRVSKKLMPKTRKDDRKRLQRRVINDAFEQYMTEAFLPEASEADTKPKKRYHEVFRKDKKPKFDARFKIFKNVSEMSGSDLLGMIEDIHEEHGAGEEGTDELANRYKDDTPGQETAKLKEGKDLNTLWEENSCALISAKQMKEFEKVVDKLFEKFGIDFEFTKHFGERMSHERNNPCITLKELAGLIKKIYAKQGKSLKKIAGSEAVVKDIQKHLNIPVVVKYDAANDEFDVVAKTIMRKPNFKSPDKTIGY